MPRPSFAGGGFVTLPRVAGGHTNLITIVAGGPHFRRALKPTRHIGGRKRGHFARPLRRVRILSKLPSCTPHLIR